MGKVLTIDDIKILYEDNQILVVAKPQNVPSQEDSTGDPDMLTVLKQYIKEKYNKEGNVFLGLVHRLDRPTGGVMVFARNSKSAARLSAAIVEGEMEKTYLAVVIGRMNDKQGQLVSYLKKSDANNTVYVATSGTIGAKRAELNYKVLEDLDAISLLKVNLQTGRSHQIRVQLSSQGNPIFGDAKYGGDKYGKNFNLALWAAELVLYHPVSKQRMVFVCYPPVGEPWKKFNIDKHLDYFNAKSE